MDNDRMVKEIRIFIASPEDCAGQREAALTIIDELNRTLGISMNIALRGLTWKDVPPQKGQRAEDVILDFLNIPGRIDLFVGIMWKKFGTPTGDFYESGTAEEFHVAINAWNIKESPKIMFYFRPSLDRLTKQEIPQYQKVLDFKDRVGGMGVLYQDFGSPSQFRKLFRRQLTQVITRNQSPAPPPAKLVTSCSSYWEVWRDAFREERISGERVEAYLYRSAKSVVKFMTISGRSVWSADVEDALKSKESENFCFLLLLYDWNAADFAEKMRDERRTEEYEVDMARQKARDIARQFVMHADALRLNLQVRLYSEYPVWRMMLIDDAMAYVGYYLKNKRGYEGPMFVYQRQDEESLYYPFNQFFDKLWKRSRSLATTDLGAVPTIFGACTTTLGTGDTQGGPKESDAISDRIPGLYEGQV